MTKKCPRCRKTFDDGVTFCPDDGAALTAGNLLDPAVITALASDYRILDCLGQGGMGTVFLAEQIRVGNRKVALKVLHRKFSEDEEFITRFENEAASTGRINHPNVITIYESKQASDGTLYIAMELVEGDSLTEYLRRRGELPVPESVDILVQCCKALQAAHRLGIIHRDIKPDNIMLTKDEDGGLQIKILDFGIAKLKDSSGHTVTGSVLGTPAYMSYEQASGMSSEKLDGRSDLYSLGIVAYTMLVGHPPFRADTPVGYITKHLSDPVPPLRTQRADLPALVEIAVLKALEKDREKRHQTAGEFAAALREALKASAAPLAATPVPMQATPTPAPPWRARSPAGQTTEVGLASSGASVAATTPAVPTAPVAPRVPSADAPTLPAAATAAASPAAAAPTAPPGPAAPAPPRAAPPRAAPPRAAPTGPKVVVPDAPAPVATPAGRRPGGPGERTTTPVATPTPPIQRPAASAPRPVPTERPARPAPRPPAPPQVPSSRQAMALWGIRKLVSWTLLAAALMFLVVFAWPIAGGSFPSGLGLVIFYVTEPITQFVTQVVGPVRMGNWDPIPLVLAVLLFVLRPYLTGPLWRLEKEARQRAAVEQE